MVGSHHFHSLQIGVVSGSRGEFVISLIIRKSPPRNVGLNTLSDTTTAQAALRFTTTLWVSKCIDQGTFAITAFTNHQEDLGISPYIDHVNLNCQPLEVMSLPPLLNQKVHLLDNDKHLRSSKPTYKKWWPSSSRATVRCRCKIDVSRS